MAKKKWTSQRDQERRQEIRHKMEREMVKADNKAYGELHERWDTKDREKDLYRLARKKGSSWERSAAS